jgi:hypothetical protein
MHIVFHMGESVRYVLFREALAEQHSGAGNGWIFEHVDYELLKLFFISLLWRAHAADNSFFNPKYFGS